MFFDDDDDDDDDDSQHYLGVRKLANAILKPNSNINAKLKSLGRLYA